MKTITYFFLLLVVFSFKLNAQENISVCTDDDDWFPYVYLNTARNNKVEGIVISTTQDIFAQLGYTAQFQATPWLRCMEQLKKGTIDVVIAGTYTKERAKYAHFPDDAEKLTDSHYVLARDPFVLITHRSNKFIYQDNDFEIPTPVRAQHGYNLTNELLSRGVDIKEYYSNQSALDDLVKTKIGSVLINRMSADNMLSEPTYGMHLHYNSTPVRVVPYFIMFSKKSEKLSEEQRNNFYQQLRQWRERKRARSSY